jgi:hypothetical protein
LAEERQDIKKTTKSLLQLIVEVTLQVLSSSRLAGLHTCILIKYTKLPHLSKLACVCIKPLIN